MQTLDFNSEEVELLHETMHHAIQQIDLEIYRTDTHEFKERLKHRRQVLSSALSKLETLPAAAVLLSAYSAS
jgi:hypothetical protein